MKRITNYLPFFVAIAMSLTLTSCEAIGGIFKAGVWVGVLAVVILIIVIIKLVGGSKK